MPLSLAKPTNMISVMLVFERTEYTPYMTPKNTDLVEACMTFTARALVLAQSRTHLGFTKSPYIDILHSIGACPVSQLS